VYLAAATTIVGVAVLAYGMFGSGVSITGRLASIGFGSVVLFFGVALFSPRLVRPLASSLGRPPERFGGAPGRLARENSMRNPTRVAVTASALMIGLALVTFVAVLGQGLRHSYGASLNKQIHTDYLLTAQDGFSPFPPEVADSLRRNPAVSTLTTIRENQVKAFGKKVTIDRIEPDTVAANYHFHWKPGSDAALAALGSTGAIVNYDFAKDHHLTVGKRLQALASDGTRVELVVRGIDKPPSFNPLGLGKIYVAPALFDHTFPTQRNRFVLFDTRGGASAATTASLKTALKPFPEAKLFTQASFRKQQDKNLNQFLGLLYVLLALSVIVSLFGIVNTLVLSVFERTREIGMLRAIGMTRRQVRRMIRYESVIVALIGSLLGMVVGIFLSGLVTAALAGEGLTFSLPVGTLIGFLIVAALAGVAAAVLPARRAARLNVLEALQYE
jgi:putative ABC transport system permease protein